jgi:hypothetical protein
MLFVYRLHLFYATVQQSPTLCGKHQQLRKNVFVPMPVRVGFVEDKVAAVEVSLRVYRALILRSSCFPEKRGVNKKDIPIKTKGLKGR